MPKNRKVVYENAALERIFRKTSISQARNEILIHEKNERWIHFDKKIEN